MAELTDLDRDALLASLTALTREDPTPFVSARLVEPTDDCSLPEALGTIGSVASLPTLCRVHDETTYSYARCAALDALATNLETDALRARAREGLWDCDSATRALAADRCDATDPVVRARLVALASDPFEARDVREAATEAIG